MNTQSVTQIKTKNTSATKLQKRISYGAENLRDGLGPIL